jgi:hypothetical protein
LSANQTTSFFLVSGFGFGAYSAKLLNGTRLTPQQIPDDREYHDQQYAMIMRLPMSDCDGIGYSNMPYARQRAERRGPQFTRGTSNHPDGDLDVLESR